MDSLNDAGSFHLHNRLSDFFSVLASEHEFRFSRAGRFNLAVFVDIAVSVATKHNRLFPACDRALNIFHKNRSAENSAVKLTSDDSVGAWGKLL